MSLLIQTLIIKVLSLIQCGSSNLRGNSRLIEPIRQSCKNLTTPPLFKLARTSSTWKDLSKRVTKRATPTRSTRKLIWICSLNLSASWSSVSQSLLPHKYNQEVHKGRTKDRFQIIPIKRACRLHTNSILKTSSISLVMWVLSPGIKWQSRIWPATWDCRSNTSSKSSGRICQWWSGPTCITNRAISCNHSSMPISPSSTLNKALRVHSLWGRIRGASE